MSKSDSNQIREFREQFGMTQASLGEMLGTKPATVSHWETGRRQLPDYISKRLSRLHEDLESAASKELEQTLIIGEARMSDGQVDFYSWDARLETVPKPSSAADVELRALILRDIGRNVEINGWLAFFSLKNEKKYNTLSIMKFEGEAGFCGFLRDMGNNRTDAESFFGEKRLEDVTVVACYPITWMKAPLEESEAE